MSRTAKEIETTGLPCEAQNGETIQVVPKVDVTMFGKFTLKQEGMEVPHAVSLTGRSRRLWTLTAYLILNRNRGVSAQELIDLLWPEAENDNPLSTLQNNVSRARAALAELGFTHAKVIIHNEKGYYRWAPDRETQLDVEQFETLAKAALAEEDMEKSVALAQEAVALYTGDFSYGKRSGVLVHQPQHVLPLALYAPMSRGGGSPFEARTHYGCGKALHGRYPFRSRRRGIQRVFDAGAHKKQKPEKSAGTL